MIGDREWVLSVAVEHEAKLLRFATRLLRDPDVATDAVQFTLLKLCEQSPEQLKGREAAWLFTVCRNRIRDLLRRKNRPESLEQTVINNRSHEPLAREKDPAEMIERRELHECIERLIDRLPEHQQEALSLWREGLSYQEIAEITSAKPASIRVSVHRALMALRQSPVVRRLFDELNQPTGFQKETCHEC